MRFHCKLELKQTFWDLFTKMGVCESTPHSVIEGITDQLVGGH